MLFSGLINLKETEIDFPFLDMHLKFDDILLFFVLYLLYKEHTENSSLFMILFLLLAT